jgi:hypothetical protein
LDDRGQVDGGKNPQAREQDGLFKSYGREHQQACGSKGRRDGDPPAVTHVAHVTNLP